MAMADLEDARGENGPLLPLPVPVPPPGKVENRESSAAYASLVRKAFVLFCLVYLVVRAAYVTSTASVLLGGFSRLSEGPEPVGDAFAAGVDAGPSQEGLAQEGPAPDSAQSSTPTTQPFDGLPTSYYMLCGEGLEDALISCENGELVSKVFYPEDSFLNVEKSGKSETVQTKLQEPLCKSGRVGADFGYNFPIRPGDYRVHVHTYEPHWKDTGKRVFTVLVQGEIAAKDVDVAAAVGPDRRFEIPGFDIQVKETEEHAIVVDFHASAGTALCSAIEIIRIGEGRGKAASRHSLPLPSRVLCAPGGAPTPVMVGAAADVALRPLGALEGFQLYSYRPTEAGQYRVVNADNRDEVLMEAYVLPDECDCPLEFEQFLQQYQCSAEDANRISDLFSFWGSRGVNWDMFQGRGAPDLPNVVRCTILSNKLYCSNPEDRDPAREAFNTLILSLLRKVKMVDVEFYWHPYNSPISPSGSFMPPVLGPVTEANFQDVPFPSLHTINTSLGGKDWELLGSLPSWEERTDKLVFDAQDGSVFQNKLVMLREEDSTVQPWDVVASGAVLVTQKRNKREYYELALRPMADFLQLEVAPEEFEQEIADVFKDRGALKAISESARRHFLTRMRQQDVLCWAALVLRRLKDALGFDLGPRDEVALVENHGTECDCERR